MWPDHKHLNKTMPKYLCVTFVVIIDCFEIKFASSVHLICKVELLHGLPIDIISEKVGTMHVGKHHILAFAKEKDWLSVMEIDEKKTIANVRIHVK